MSRAADVSPGSCDIGLIGLAVMGQNLVLNMEDNGATVAVFNRTTSKVDDFLVHEAKGKKIVGASTPNEFCNALKLPRRIIMLVQAGGAVDATMASVLPYLSPGDILIDGGNSHFPDTERRYCEMQARQIRFVGMGVSGGEEGARHGPSIMPGGAVDAWSSISPILRAISAKTDGEPCCDWIGPGGSGHYVKMVHNGIEYGDMQLLCEAFHVLQSWGISSTEAADIFKSWNEGPMASYLVEITAAILAFKDPVNPSEALVDNIRDCAMQKGTGKWTAQDALDLAVPVTLIAEAVFARCLSSLIDERAAASAILNGPADSDIPRPSAAEKAAWIQDLHDAVYAAKIVSYAQGFMLLREAAKVHKWGSLNYGAIALMWRGGCIIRSVFLGKVKEAFNADENISCLLLAPYFAGETRRCAPGWRRALCRAVAAGIPTPALSCAMAFYDGYRSKRLPANLLQAQRDYFGAHQFERLNAPGTWEHANWTGSTGRVTSTVYNT